MLWLLAASSAGAGPWQECRLDYWGDCRPLRPPAKPEGNPRVPAAPERKNERSSIRALDDEPFDWRHYEDPKDIRFWDDGGDYVPARPLREVLADPTAENVERYRRWVARKLELAQRGQQLVWGTPPRREKPEPVDLTTPTSALVNWREVSIVYFYQAACPHCQASTALVHELEERGAQVLAVHLDRASADHPRSVAYTAEMAANLRVEGTPTWLVDVRGTQTVVRGRTTLERLARVVRFLKTNEEGT